MWKKNIYIKNNLDPYPINRTKIDLFLDCKKCFYINLTFGIRRPHGTPLAINNAVERLFKNEFDFYRVKKKPHPIIISLKKDLMPINHPKLEEWRNSFKGIKFLHKKTNFLLNATINDLWLDYSSGSYVMVDYKSTAKKEVFEHVHIWPGYWKHLSFYKYLLENLELKVSDTGYLLYANAQKEAHTFNGILKFDIKLFSQVLDFSWVENLLDEIYVTLQSDIIPDASINCKFCRYLKNINSITNEKL